MADLSAAKPDPMEIIEARPDGSGVVRVPILRAGQSIDLALTAGGGKGSWDVTREQLQEMVRNFKEFPGPVPIGVSPHQSYGARSGFSISFLEGLSLRGDDLMGDVWCMAPLFAEVTGGNWRGFSGEFGRDLELPTKKLKGWCVYGGVFTNRPATDSHFTLKVAAEGTVLDAARFLDHKQKELQMPENTELSVRLATVEAEAKDSAVKVISLEGKVAELRDENKGLSVKLEKAAASLDTVNAELQVVKVKARQAEDRLKDSEVELESAQAESKKLRSELAEVKDANLSAVITRTVRAAIQSGVPPSTFDGYDKDPVAWLKGSFVTLENLQRVITGLPKTAALSAVKSGHKPDPDDSAAISPERAAALRKMGLNPALATVSTESEALAILESKK